MHPKNEIDRYLDELSLIATAGYAVGLHIRFAAPVVMFYTYSDDWRIFYTENTYGLRDPIIGWGLSETGSIRWSELTLPDPFGVIQKAASYGLKFGGAVSCGPLASRSIAGFARATAEFTDSELREASRIVQKLHDLTDPPASLTNSQREALLLLATGDRHAAAAAKLGISESALKARLNSARTRLSARTTTEAIQRAKEYRLI